MRKLIISILVLTSLAASSQTKDHYGKYRFDSLYSTLAQKGIDTTNFKIVVERETDGKHFKMYWPTYGGTSLSGTGYVKMSGTTPSYNATIPNADLTNSTITIAGNSTALGGSVTQDNITGLSSTGIVKRTGANTLAIATAGTDYQSPITLTTTGSSGAASFVAGTLNIPNYSVTSTSWNGGTNGTSYSATSSTIDGNSLIWTFTGSSPATFTLPSYATFGNRVVLIKNIGSADLTITRAGTDQIYTTSAVTSFTLSAGKSVAISAAANGLTNTWETLFDPTPFSLTTTGTSGVSTYDNTTGVLNIPNYASGGTTWNGVIGGSAALTGTTLTITTGTAMNIAYQGTADAVYTLPSLSAAANRIWFIKNESAFNLTVQRAGTDQMYTTSLATSTVLGPGEGRIFISGSVYWDVHETGSTGGSGTVTSIDLTTPSWLTVSGSPVTTSGTLAVTATTGQTANRFLATPDGSTGAVSLRAIVAADIPTLNQNTTGSAAKFTTARNINGVAFDGTANITVPSDIAASTSGNVLTSNGTVWTSAANNGGWTTVRVSGSDATTTGQTLVDITGLASGTLTNSTKYEIEAVLDVSTSAVTTGTEYGIGAGGTGGAAVVSVILTGTTTGTSASSEGLSTTAGTASTARLLTSGQSGTIMLKGFVTTRGSGTATISVQHLKVTSGTSTVKIGSVFRYRLAQ
jgi:hypothetical protein